MSETDKMIARKEGSIGFMIFNNPERHNAVSLHMWERAGAILAQFAKDDDVRVLVVTGAGSKAFISGADISRFESERSDLDAAKKYNTTVEHTYAAMESFPKPSIAMIRGFCMGGGLGFALGCDMRIASDDARFALPAAKLGLGYGLAGIGRFVDIVGPAFTKEIFFTARTFDAAEALDMGLVNRVLAGPQLEPYVRDYAETIAGNAPLTVAATKFIVGEVLKDPNARDTARCEVLVQQCFASRDYEEGRKAFMEKRKPVFKGR
jgi:enoyl-CoA hydratase/carnithine racemase